MSQSIIYGLVGGAFIGTSAILLMLLNGRIAGISGIFSGAIFPQKGDHLWRVAFLAGMVSGGLLAPLLFNISFEFELNASLPVIVAGGFLVGFGTSMGSGCTSGHAVCGVARFSRRSIVATLTFISSGVITVAVIRHLL